MRLAETQSLLLPPTPSAVTNFGNFAFPLLTIGWELTVDYICIALMATSVQLYFAHRVWSAFGRSLLISIPFGFLITFTFVGGITSGALSLRSGSAANVRGSALQSFQPDSTPWRFSVVFATWLIGMAVTDVGLCALLVLQLSKMKSRESLPPRRKRLSTALLS